MRRRLIYAAALVLAFLAGSITTSRVHAQNPQTWKHVKTLKVPAEWGVFRDAKENYLIFEDGHGVLRLAIISSGLQNYIEVQRDPTATR